MKGLWATRGRATLVAAAVVLAASSTAAVGYWTSAGGGSAVTVASAPQPVTFSLGAPTTLLYPGHDAGVAIVAHNPNPFSVRVSALAVANDPGPVFTADAGHSDCDVAVLSFVAQDNDGTGWTVPRRVGSTDGALTIDMPAALHMGSGAANACQGATIGVRLRTP